MGVPTFRFVAGPDGAEPGDEQFWRDVDASDRLRSRFKANLYLRELCHSRACEDAATAGELDPFARERREQALLRAVLVRGYRLFGPDLATPDSTALRAAS